DCDDNEVLAPELLVDGLPHGQVEAAPSPGGPGVEQDLLAPVVGQTMDAPIQIRQREVRCLTGPKAAALDVSGLGEQPDATFVIVNDRLAYTARESGEIETIAAKPRLVSRQRHTHVTLAGPLGFELPAARPLQVRDWDPEVLSLG